MQKFCMYLKLECKRILRLFPGMIIITLLILAICGIFFKNDIADQLNSQKNSKNVKTLKIGIVYSEEDEQFLGLGFYMLEHADDIGYICKFKQVTAEEGQMMLDNEEIDVLAIFPDDYVRSVYHGIEEPITIRFGTAQSGISSLMFKQLSQAISSYMMESKAGVYAMQDMYISWKFNYSSDADKLAEKYVLRILDRSSMIDQQSVDATDGLNSTMYYICVGIVLVFLFWGLNCGSVLGKNEKMLSALLERQRLSKFNQYSARYLALMLLFVLNYVVIAIFTNIITWKMQLDILPETYFFKLLPVLLLLCALVLCVYEISNDGIGGMIFFFFTSLIMGFVSGFFYPLSYFPMWMQNIAHFLPTRIMFEYTCACVKNSLSAAIVIKLLLCTIIFIVFTNMYSKIRFNIIAGQKKSRRSAR